MNWLLLSWLAVVGGVTLCPAATANKPNVLILITDDQGYGELSCHGNPILKTPNLDRLHAESVRFADFHVAPMCTPTRSQLMTGLDALRNGAMNVSSGRTLLRRDLPTMPQLFARAGYRTGLFGKWHLGDAYPYRPEDRGFDEALWFPSSHIGSVPDTWENDYFDDTYIHNGQRKAYRGYTTDVFFREAIRWMREQAAERKPFFCYLATAAPHWPFYVPAEYREAMQRAFNAAKSRLPKLPEQTATDLIRFLAMIANIDDNFGRLEQFLRDAGLRDNTIVVFLTDNGSTFGPRYFNAGMKGGKTTLWEGGHRVPCFIRWPAGNLRAPCDLPGLAHAQDLLPTLLDLCGIPLPSGTRFDGISLADALRGKTEVPPDRMLVINFSRMPLGINRYTTDNPAVPRREGAAVLWKRWRLLEDRELYNLETDPLQQRNVITDHPDIARQMRAHLDRWWNGLKDVCNEFQPSVIGSDAENPVMLTACEWADVFVDQQLQVRRGERKNGFWHIEVAHAGRYAFELRRFPPESGLKLCDAVAQTQLTDGVLGAGPAWTVAKARLKIGEQVFEKTVAPSDVAARFEIALPAGRTVLQTWFLDSNGEEIAGAYYVRAERMPPPERVKIIFDTDMSGDCDDAGALVLLHALADRGECELLAVLTNRKDKTNASAAAVDAINTYYGRPNIPIGTDKQGPTDLQRTSPYAAQLRDEFPNDIGPDDRAPDAFDVYRRVLWAQPDHSVTISSVGTLSNLAELCRCEPELIRRKVRQLVVMGGEFPVSKRLETNIRTHREAAKIVAAEWPGEIIWHGFEIGDALITGSRLRQTPKSNPVRRAYELRQYQARASIEGGQPSFDQAAALYAVRGPEPELWQLSPAGRVTVDDEGNTAWQPLAEGKHRYVRIAGDPKRLAETIEVLMTAPPRVKIQSEERR
ncbi:MAG: sulfatase-like hydrolase/transferase [Verrucomicrobiae bacterium]|nr:sulfatase-like hydrolase/transferase [Verrucomicrobiae bacterium]